MTKLNEFKRLALKHLFFICIAFFVSFICQARELNILVTITPIYSLVKNVTGDLQNVQLLIDKNMCPHDYQMRPSDVRKLNKADLVIAVGDGFETFLFNYLNKASIQTNTARLVDIKGLVLLSSKGVHQHGHNKHGEEQKVHLDWHLWPSIKNAQVIVRWVASKLSALDPENSQTYLKNAQATILKLKNLGLKLHKELDPLQGKNFIVLNDEYQYLEKDYDLSNVGSVVMDKTLNYSAKKLEEIKRIVKAKKVKCILVEPHMPSQLVKKIEKITGSTAAYVDIEWGRPNEKTPDKDLYFSMMERSARNISRCLLTK